jgi:ASC-1-like (ASCH) protein
MGNEHRARRRYPASPAAIEKHATELYSHCLSATGVYEAFGELIKRMGLEDIFPGFEGVQRELKQTLDRIDKESGG